MTPTGNGRVRQKERTRRALIEACERLLGGDSSPSLEDVAVEAGVSRATAYRYFGSYADLIADVHMERVGAETTAHFAGADAPDTLVGRVHAARRANNDFLFGDEVAAHHFVRQAAERWLKAHSTGDTAPVRPGRRRHLIATALDPFREEMDDAVLRRLEAALTLPIGTEAVVALRDVAGLGSAEAGEVAAWVCEALVDKALSESGG